MEETIDQSKLSRCTWLSWQAVQLFGQIGALLELRAFSDGVLVVQALRHSDAQVCGIQVTCFQPPSSNSRDKAEHCTYLVVTRARLREPGIVHNK